MKNIITVIGILLTILFVSCFNDTKSEKKIAREQYKSLINNHPYQETLKLSKKELKSKGLPPNKYFEQEYLLEMNPTLGRTTPENLLEIQNALQEKGGKSNRTPGDAANNAWVDRGPNNIGGRTRALLFDPNDINNANPADDYTRVFAGGVSGGLWVNDDITDENSNWIRAGITENLGVSSITVDPNNSMTWYAGTGESYTSNDGAGSGLWKSINGGASWFNLIPVNFNESETARLYTINDVLAWDNAGSTEVFMAASREYDYQNIGYQITGLWKSTDNGSSWARVSLNTPSGSPYEVNSIKISQDNSIWVSTRTNAYGKGGGKIFKSTDGLVFDEKYSFTDGHRVEIACSKTNANTVYALAELKTGDWPYTTPYLSLVKTTDEFVSGSSPETVELSLPNDADSGIEADDFTRGQAFYDLMISVDPSDDTVVYVGGIDLFRSEDSGNSWNQISKWNRSISGSFSEVHADQHEMVFRPSNNNEAIFGNDGGVYYSNTLSTTASNSSTIEARNKDYNVTQFYKGAIGQDQNNELLLAGAQDNGSLFIESAVSGANAAVVVFGGDGAYEFIDKDGDYMIVSYIYNSYGILALPYTGAGAYISEDQESGEFINPADLDDSLDILYANSTKDGLDSIARYSNLFSESVRTNFTDPLLTSSISALKVSPFTTTSSTVLVGTETGKILKITNADTTPIWQDLDASEAIAVGSISCIEFGESELEIFVTLHNYGIENIWYTENGGVSWSSKDGDFPDIPVKAIMKNPLNSNEVIIGTNLGVWMTSDFSVASPNWVQSQNGMSNVKVTSFDLRTSDNTVLASTYGRGMFTSKFLEGALSVEENELSVEEFKIFPTVSKGRFFMSSSIHKNIKKFEIYNSNGASVYLDENIELSAGEKESIALNTSSGIYFIKVIDENGELYEFKIMIE